MSNEGGLGFGFLGPQGSPEDQIPPAVPGTVLSVPSEAQQQHMSVAQPGQLGVMQQQFSNGGGM